MDNQEIHLNEQDPSKIAGRKILMIFLSVFCLVMSVNAFFVYQAFSTYNGVVSENAYERGLNFNEIIEKARAQNEQQSNTRNSFEPR